MFTSLITLYLIVVGIKNQGNLYNWNHLQQIDKWEWRHGLSGYEYRVAMLSLLYPIVKGIIIQKFKSERSILTYLNERYELSVTNGLIFKYKCIKALLFQNTNKIA